MQSDRASARPGRSLSAEPRYGRRWRVACVLGVAVGFALLAQPAYAQAAQANWWESLTGTGAPDYTGEDDAERPRAKSVREPPDDLRSDLTPWRSDEMILALEAAIGRYEHLVSQGGWPRVPEGRLMREDDEEGRVRILRKRLYLSGDLRKPTSVYNSDYFDEELVKAVRRFQRRHGLRTTGRVERSTYPALNVTAAQRLAQLRLNLRRIRDLMAAPAEDRYILVNVPAFQLEAVEKFEAQRRHRVIVGRTGRQSPSINATVRALNFFPYWRVPDSVAHLDLIPRLFKEPDFLANEKIRVLDGLDGPEVDPGAVNWGSPDALKLKFRQDPGPQNALGIVRIDMPNSENVYLHDTPMKTLFNQNSRAFSAGCVRVQGVLDLVDWIARYEPGWQPGRAQSIVQARQAVDVTLTRPIPVHFVYITAWAERDGTVEFRPDIYGRDGAVDTIADLDRDPNDPLPPVTLAP